MAKKTRFRIKAGLKDLEQADLDSIVQRFAPYQEEMLNAIESGDAAAVDAIFKRVNLGDQAGAIRDRLGTLMGKLPAQNVAYREFIGRTEDEANLTDEELQAKAEAFKGLEQTGEPIYKDAIKREVKQLLDQYSIKVMTKPKGYEQASEKALEGLDLPSRVERPELKSALENVLNNFILRGRRLPDAGELRDDLIANGISEIDAQAVLSDPAISNFLNDQNAKNYVQLTLAQGGRKYPEDIRRIEDILRTRATTAEKEKAVAEYLRTGPEELARARGQFVREQQEAGGRFLRLRTPRILEELNIRGLAENEPDISSSIAALGGRLQGTLEDQIRAQEAADNAMFADAAFRITQAKLEASEDTLREQIAFERQKARAGQEVAFRRREADIASEFEKASLAKEGERGLRQQREELELGRKTSNEELAANLIGEAGTAAGQVGATKVVTGAPALPKQIG